MEKNHPKTTLVILLLLVLVAREEATGSINTIIIPMPTDAAGVVVAVVVDETKALSTVEITILSIKGEDATSVMATTVQHRVTKTPAGGARKQ